MAASNSDVLLAEAQKAYQAGDLTKMRELLKQALAADPKNFNAWLLATYATNNPTQLRQFIDRAKAIKRTDARILMREKELFPDIDNGFSFEPDLPQLSQPAQAQPIAVPQPVLRGAPKHKPLSPTDHIPTLADGLRLKRQNPLKIPLIALIPVGLVVLGIFVLALLPPSTGLSTSFQSLPSAQPAANLDATQGVLMQTATGIAQTRNAMLAAPTLTATYLAPVQTQTAIVAQQTALNAALGATQTQAVVVLTETALWVELTTNTPAARTQVAATATQNAVNLKSALTGRLVAAKSLQGKVRIVTLNADGSNLTNLGAVGIDPVWSPDGQSIVYMNREHQFWLHVMKNDGSGDLELPIKDSPFGTGQAAWSSDGSKLIFAAGIHFGPHALMVVNPQGLNQVQIMDDNQAGDWPNWSPDGKHIVYSKSDQVFIINADGSNSHAIARQAGAHGPVWSPDGQHIAFDAGDDNDRGLYMMNADGSDLHRITSKPNYVTNPAWSPDGKHLAGLCYGLNTNQICVMNADGTSLTLITEGGFDGRLSWKP